MKFSLALIAAVLPFISAATLERRAWTLPPVNGIFDYQLGGSYAPNTNVAVLTRDSSASGLAGKYNICYVNGFQTQPQDKQWWQTNHPNLLLKKANGQLFEDPDWPGEFFLDTRTAANRVALTAVMGPRYVDGCAQRGFQAIEIDNLDTFWRAPGLITMDHNIAYATLLTKYAHDKGLAVGQKNAMELGARGKNEAKFDFVVAENCQEWNECQDYMDVYGNNMISIEYNRSYFDASCKARGSKISIVLRDRLVVPKGKSGYVYDQC
ncbi:hypothetical protein BDV98DRAFT_534908 [Pterulicium gracile]|uniref:alpha-galactosidase n=1 Tax=Pterulicium gracile TaxID=1884261 RepID=A0A5C3Q6W4_9AGAR|nr:hypothetical protein BDV98DRAFT_534908 [Pterula gracilis]